MEEKFQVDQGLLINNLIVELSQAKQEAVTYRTAFQQMQKENYELRAENDSLKVQLDIQEDSK